MIDGNGVYAVGKAENWEDPKVTYIASKIPLKIWQIAQRVVQFA